MTSMDTIDSMYYTVTGFVDVRFCTAAGLKYIYIYIYIYPKFEHSHALSGGSERQEGTELGNTMLTLETACALEMAAWRS